MSATAATETLVCANCQEVVEEAPGHYACSCGIFFSAAVKWQDKEMLVRCVIPQLPGDQPWG